MNIGDKVVHMGWLPLNTPNYTPLEKNYIVEGETPSKGKTYVIRGFYHSNPLLGLQLIGSKGTFIP